MIWTSIIPTYPSAQIICFSLLGQTERRGNPHTKSGKSCAKIPAQNWNWPLLAWLLNKVKLLSELDLPCLFRCRGDILILMLAPHPPPVCGFMELSRPRTDHGADDLNVSQRLWRWLSLSPPSPRTAMGAQTWDKTDTHCKESEANSHTSQKTAALVGFYPYWLL